MSIGKSHPLLRQPIHIGRIDLATLRIIASDIAVSQVIGIEDDDIGLCLSILFGTAISTTLISRTP
jgi:hypothetical protein